MPDDRQKLRLVTADAASDAARAHDQRQAIPVIVDDAPAITRAPAVRLTTAAVRLVATAVGDMRERLGDVGISATPPIEPAYLDDGKVSLAIILTAKVADLNAEAARDEAHRPHVEAAGRESVAVADAEREALAALRAWYAAQEPRDVMAAQAKLRIAARKLERAEAADGLTDHERRVLAVLDGWQTPAAIAERAGLTAIEARTALQGLFNDGKAAKVGGEWGRL